MLTAKQCKAARAALGWSQEDLAREAFIGRVTVALIELGPKKREIQPDTYRAIERAFSDAGIVFTDDVYGVNWRNSEQGN